MKKYSVWHRTTDDLYRPPVVAVVLGLCVVCVGSVLLWKVV
jgi:hypothetical protein